MDKERVIARMKKLYDELKQNKDSAGNITERIIAIAQINGFMEALGAILEE